MFYYTIKSKHILIDSVVPGDYEDEEEEDGDSVEDDDKDIDEEVKYITDIESFDALATFQNTFAQIMFNNW